MRVIMKRTIKYILPVMMLAVSLTGCSYIQKNIDIYSIKDISEDIMNDFHTGKPGELRKLVESVDLSESTRLEKNVHYTITPLKKWSMNSGSRREIIEEKIQFPAYVNIEGGNRNAIFYVYRRGSLKNRNVILWIPGMGVSDFAFRFIKKFFKEELSRDYDIVFYNIPYHLERRKPDGGNGDGFLTSNNSRNIRLFLNSVKEVRTAVQYLKKKGVKSISGWGGSIGATIILLSSIVEKFDHLTVMIPAIDLNLIALDNRYMQNVVSEMKKNGFMESDIREAYRIVSPVNYSLNVPPERVLILYAKYDQLTPPDLIKRYARRNKIKNILGYRRSHSTILLTSEVYRDYGLFLDSLNNNQ
jgi:pimeloyl-ACP methyl ester carboxylesterase